MTPRTALTLVVVEPGGRRSNVTASPFPFLIGRSPECNLVLRDSRISRTHARIVHSNGACMLEDLDSRHGVWVNGERLTRPRILSGSEKIEFGVPDGYQIVVGPNSAEPERLQVAPDVSGTTGTANLERLRAVLEVARSLEASLSSEEVLHSVVDAALAITGAERGFLLLFDAQRELQIRSARARGGGFLADSELRVPLRLIRQALESRRDMFTMQFDPTALEERSPGNTIALLELRSVCCVPLLRINLGAGDRTQVSDVSSESAGVLYMDSRISRVDVAGGNRELLQTLAIEASTVLENARLLEQQRQKHKMEEELELARGIQQSLLPRTLPDEGWFRACGFSKSSHEVGGDYYDVISSGPDMNTVVIADVAGKGVSSAILASFLQGVFLGAAGGPDISEVLSRVNNFLTDRGDHGKYATLFFANIESSGRVTWANAGHCAPLLIRATGEVKSLPPTSMPVGMIPGVPFPSEQLQLHPGDRLILYTDGVTEAQNHDGDFFGKTRLRSVTEAASNLDCSELYEAVQDAIQAFTEDAGQSDDVTLVVIEYAGHPGYSPVTAAN